MRLFKSTLAWLASVSKFNLAVISFFAAPVVVYAATEMIHMTSTPEFCTKCHEMEVVADNGWMHSRHYVNSVGVRAECADCHIPPGVLPTLWTKTRDGSIDILTHIFGESDPGKMDWDHLAKVARSRIPDASCKRCHGYFEPSTPAGHAHQQNASVDEPKRCVDCHNGLHDGFRKTLYAKNNTTREAVR